MKFHNPFKSKSNPLHSQLVKAKEVTAPARKALGKYGAPAVAGVAGLFGPLGTVFGQLAGQELVAIEPGDKHTKLKNAKTTAGAGAIGFGFAQLFGSIGSAGLLTSVFGAGKAAVHPATGEPVAAGSGDNVGGAEGGYTSTGLPMAALKEPSALQSVFGNVGGGAERLLNALTNGASDGTVAGPAAQAAAEQKKALIVKVLVTGAFIVGGFFIVRALRH